MAARPQMPRYRTFRHIEVFRSFPNRARHMAILALLAPQSRVVEVFSPFEEGLGLFADDAFPQAVTVSAHPGTLDIGVRDRWMRCIHRVRPSDLSLGGKVATGTG